MESLEARKAEVEAALRSAPAPKPILHPAMAVLYRQKVANLSAALNAEGTRPEAVTLLRGLIETIVLTPEPDGYAILLKGDLARILALAAEAEHDKTAVASGPPAVSQVSLVAGAGYQRCLSLPICILKPLGPR